MLLLLLAVIAALCIWCIVLFFKAIRIARKTDRFFDEYEPDSGVVYDYSVQKASAVQEACCTNDPYFISSLSDYQQEEYFIRLACQNKGKRFLLTFQIPEGEFKKSKIGTEVVIQKNWVRIGHCLLD